MVVGIIMNWCERDKVSEHDKGHGSFLLNELKATHVSRTKLARMPADADRRSD